MFAPEENKSIFTHGNKAYTIVKKKVDLIKMLRNIGFGKNICIIQAYNEVTEQVGKSLGGSSSEHSTTK